MEYGGASTNQKVGKENSMENIETPETPVTELVTENVEQQTTEQIAEEKTYTQAEVDAMVKEKLDQVLPGKIARKEAKIRKEFESKYGELETVLKAGLGKESVEEITGDLKQYYGKRGVQMPQKPEYTARDIEVLAEAEARDIIRNGGEEEIVEETDRLNKKGIANMTPREKVLFKTLAEHRQNAERSKALASIGVTEDVYNSQAFKDFAGKFNSSTPITEIYDLYRKTQPQKEIKPMGSMKQGQNSTGVKDYYTPEEISRLTEEDLDDPKVWEAVRRSMTGR